jgi:hypothetical protein
MRGMSTPQCGREEGTLETAEDSAIAQLKRIRSVLQHQIDDAKQKIQAIDVSLLLLAPVAVAKELREPAFTIPPEDVNSLRSLTQNGALKAIARANKGYVKVADASRMLVTADKIQNPKNAYRLTYRALSRSEDFEKVPGSKALFRLTEQGRLPIVGTELK